MSSGSNRFKYHKYKGDLKTAKELAKISNTTPKAFNARLRRGYTIEEAINPSLRVKIKRDVVIPKKEYFNLLESFMGESVCTY